MRGQAQGQFIQQWTVSNSNWADLTSDVPQQLANGRVDVVFTNDYADSTADRNLLVDTVNIHGNVIAAQSSAVYYDTGDPFDGVYVGSGVNFAGCPVGTGACFQGALRFTPGSTNNLTFTGREDDGTGLIYYRARYYSADLQRFIAEDPLGFGGGDTNLYRYVGNAPHLAVDPSGLQQTKSSPTLNPNPAPSREFTLAEVPGATTAGACDFLFSAEPVQTNLTTCTCDSFGRCYECQIEGFCTQVCGPGTIFSCGGGVLPPGGGGGGGGGGTLPSISGVSSFSAQVGTDITISGSNLSNATAVRFGNVPAAFTLNVSTNAVTAAVPPNAPTAPISVVTPSGTTQTAQNFVPVQVATGPTPSTICSSECR
ncbi:RHS repeat-associated core domain-containing protein [Anthocerotibacter panamensis]|uniref:RHS repeat-associated core domain-containing protein n=1 Tax=Anthocerotibacter panamensis TaxID=2857077 RepID=UPI00247A1457|nr:RHS repeat-associated core domain-containing protein [Anthocerotibacter panamensis]